MSALYIVDNGLFNNVPNFSLKSTPYTNLR
ncbi:MAG: hypothetical protein RLZZ501_2518 [Pseudomonadota bacterium]|jgi:hypothetical protein